MRVERVAADLDAPSARRDRTRVANVADRGRRSAHPMTRGTLKKPGVERGVGRGGERLVAVERRPHLVGAIRRRAARRR